MNKRTLVSLAVLVAVVVAGISLWQLRYDVYDWIKLRNYIPSAQVASLADSSAFNKYGRTLFYINDPKLSDRNEFADQCKVREQTIVLGCYTGTGIYVFDVQDERLKGVEEVTAAHEMLHAAYDRLGPLERKRIDKLTQLAYDKINDPELAKRMESYKKSEPGEIPNELHSILGTEKRNLGSELEEYYKQYFTDRFVVVTLAENYEKVLIDRPNQIQKYDGDLALRKSQIDNREAALLAESEALLSLKAQLDLYSSTNNIYSYNSLVPRYNNSVVTFNKNLNSYKTLISEYNKILEQRVSLAADQETLTKSIDSRLEAIKQ